MQTISYLCFCFLTFLKIQSSYGYYLIPIDGRNLLSGNNQYGSLSSQISTLAATSVTNAQLSTILNQLQTLATSVATMQTQIAALQALAPKCPTAAAAIGAFVVNGKCLSIGGSDTGTPSTLVNFATAQTTCANNGGTLAEPSASDLSFWTNLNSVFGTKVSGLAINGMYVGVTSGATGGYSYVSGAPISNSAAVWVGKTGGPPTSITPVATTAAFVKIIAGAPNAWLNVGTATDLLTTASTATRGYICQY